MSYARFGWNGSDVYVYASVRGGFECCGCVLGNNWWHKDTDAILAHLREHEAAGHHVEADTFTEIEAEQNDARAAVGEEPEP